MGLIDREPTEQERSYAVKLMAKKAKLVETARELQREAASYQDEVARMAAKSEAINEIIMALRPLMAYADKDLAALKEEMRRERVAIEWGEG